MKQRKNQKADFQIVRLEVARAGDVAYEFSNFSLSWEVADSNEHVRFTGSALRVWKKVDRQWQIAAAFMRPHDSRFVAPNSH